MFSDWLPLLLVLYATVYLIREGLRRPTELRPMTTAPRDGQAVRLVFGNTVTIGWHLSEGHWKVLRRPDRDPYLDHAYEGEFKGWLPLW